MAVGNLRSTVGAMNSITNTLPELLSPAGNLEKLQLAYRYGADAAYVGGRVFGLRKYADNFTTDELRVAVELANRLGKQLYVVLNGFAHDVDLDELRPHLDDLESIKPHGFIISDWGVAQVARQHTSIPLHVSTQASVTNWRTVAAWKAFGAARVILAREVSVRDCEAILERCPIELEIFIHGSMCASYSGKCVISNYSAGRDSNRGWCVQSCRHEYQLKPVGDGSVTSSHLMNAKDLMGVRQIEAAIRAKIASLKIEGRMKSNLYVANATAVYRDAIDYIVECIAANMALDTKILLDFESRLSAVSNRTFSDGGLYHRPDADSILTTFGGYQKSVEIAATVKANDKDRWLLHSKNPLFVGAALRNQRTSDSTEVRSLADLLGTPIEKGHAGGIVWAQLSKAPAIGDILVTPEGN